MIRVITKNFKRKLILTILMLFGLSVYANAADVIRLVVKEDRASCTGVAPQTCFQVKYKNSKSWELFYSNILGFNYKPGYRYVLLVTRTKRANVPADASIYTYKLKKVLKKQKMPVVTGDWGFVAKHKWKLIQMNWVTQEQSPAFIVFDKEKGRVNGFAGCNSFFGSYTKGDGKLTFKQMGSTLMACADEERTKLESDFLKLISDRTFKYDVAEQTLNFYENDRLVLMFGMAPLDTP
jgi:heat shock protein HslJ